ncbi:MAG: FKBP-type peptidyl-prolyl cis-trans isomerase, partial [candidate division SR1 bacterium]|nr:FKBP-type peptidyl-prolyl cis-trans isomerase [candidate division SR1 bacterium]
EVFDTSVESVAQASGKYNPNRNYSEGLSFKVGAGQMIAGFDAGVVGMKVGETKTVKIPAAQAYGERSEENIVRFPIKDLGEDAKDAKVGMQVYLGGRFPAVITEITDTEIVFDANHELAGKDLIFDITIKNIVPAAK